MLYKFLPGYKYLQYKAHSKYGKCAVKLMKTKGYF